MQTNSIAQQKDKVVTKRDLVVYLDDGQVFVKTLKIQMDKNQRIRLLLEILFIAFVAFLTPIVFIKSHSVLGHVVTCVGGAIGVFCGTARVLCNLARWAYNLNHMQAVMGKWYVEDIAALCGDFIKAGLKVAAEEVAKKDHSKTENAD